MHRTSYKRPYAKERCIHDIRDQNHRGSADTHIEMEKPVRGKAGAGIYHRDSGEGERPGQHLRKCVGIAASSFCWV